MMWRTFTEQDSYLKYLLDLHAIMELNFNGTLLDNKVMKEAKFKSYQQLSAVQ
jgi:hypothetical protein